MQFKQPTTAIFVVLALCAVTAWYIRDNGASDSIERADPHVATDKPMLARGRENPPTTTHPTAASTNPPASLPEAAPPESLKSLLAYEASDNLAELVSRLAPVAAAGDPGAAWILTKAVQEFWQQKVFPNLYQAVRKDLATPAEARDAATLRHLDRSERRCKQLIAEGRVTRENEERSYEPLLRGMGPISEVARWRDQSEPAIKGAIRELQRRVVASRDPWAIWAMAEAVAAIPSEEEDNVYGPFFENNTDHWAWKLVACRLGYPCGPDSAEVRTACMVYGQCINEGMQGLIRHYYLTPDNYERMKATEEKLLALIAAGNVSAIFP